MSVTLRDKITATNQIAVASDGSIIASIKGNGTPPSRSMDYWTVDQFAFSANTEALLTVTESVNGAATGTFTSRVVTTGKTLRINNITLSIEQTGGTPVLMRCYVGIRFKTSGPVLATDPLVYRIGFTAASSIKTIVNFYASFPDGMEFVGDGTKCIGISAILPEYTVTTQLAKLSLSMQVYEY